MDRQRLEADLRATLDVLLLLLPPNLVQLDLDQELAKLGPAGPMVQRALGLPRGTLDLRERGYALCSRIAQLPDDQLCSLIGIIQRECLALLVTAEGATILSEDRTLSPAEWDALAAVLEELRKPL